MSGVYFADYFFVRRRGSSRVNTERRGIVKNRNRIYRYIFTGAVSRFICTAGRYFVFNVFRGKFYDIQRNEKSTVTLAMHFFRAGDVLSIEFSTQYV